VDPATVFAMISLKMRENAETVVRESRRRGLAPHLAAQEIAQDRVREAMRLRGQIVGGWR
jgi:glutamate dehydrogenase (NAD(P)+)